MHLSKTLKSLNAQSSLILLNAWRMSPLDYSDQTTWTRRMARFLIVLGVTILVLGLLWPYLSRIGLGRLPGDIIVKRDNFTFYFPLTTCLVISGLFSLILWLLNR